MAGASRGLVVVLACAVGCASGCNRLGPGSIVNGRPLYGEAVARTNDEQMLGAIVRSRYGESVGMLAVTSITANVRFSASVGGNAGIGSSESFEGNLVPLSAGVAYEENPTISYVPVQSETYLREILSPVSLETLVLMLRSADRAEMVLTLIVDQMNGVANPLFSGSRAGAFERAASLICDLTREDVLDWVDTEGGFGMLIRLEWMEEGSGARQGVEELLELLRVEEGVDWSAPWAVVPLQWSVVREDSRSISVGTRSVYEMLRLASATVEVPASHVAEGLASEAPPTGLAGEMLRIRSSTKRPKDAMVATYQHGVWFYIDARDMDSKVFFEGFGALWSARIANAQGVSDSRPVLTVPVSR